jgi:hypothetical protein
MEHEKIDPEKANAYFAALPVADQGPAQEAYDTSKGSAGRDVLKYAVRFPLILLVVFGIIALYFRSKGGYKPVELTEEDGT